MAAPEAVAAFRANAERVGALVMAALHAEQLDANTIHALVEVVGSLMMQRVLERPESLPMYLEMLASTVRYLGDVGDVTRHGHC